MKLTKEQLKQIIKEELDMAISPDGRESHEKAKEEWNKVNKELLSKLNATETLEDYKAALKALQAHLSKAPTLKTLEEQEGSFLEISISDDGYDKDIEQISNPDEVDVDVSENPYVAYRAVVKVIKSSGEL